MFPVSLCEWKITSVHPVLLVLTIKFKNFLRIFEAETVKIFNNIQPQSKNETFIFKKECFFVSYFVFPVYFILRGLVLSFI